MKVSSAHEIFDLLIDQFTFIYTRKALLLLKLCTQSYLGKDPMSKMEKLFISPLVCIAFIIYIPFKWIYQFLPRNATSVKSPI